MENLRAFLLINNIKDECSEIYYDPQDIESNKETAKIIIEKGFIIHFKALSDDKAIFNIIEESVNVKSYEIIEDNERQNEDEIVNEKPAENNHTEIVLNDSPVQAVQAQNEQVKNAKAQMQNSGGKQRLISVNLNKLDQLLDMVGEIVIAEAMVTSNIDLKGLKLDNFQKASRQLRKLTDELQDIVMSIRMVPLSGAFNKMTRIVRDMKLKLNKDVDIQFEGEETEVDKSVLDNLHDPLMHMVRNSMDHGIEEDPEERIARGKPAKGTITLSAYNSSAEVIIVVSDDGAGVNCERVMNKARENGILTKPENEYTEKEIFNLIMLPGFSTNEEVTEFSGRGVGMDVVRQNIEKIGGSVSVDSKWGEGTDFIIKIPLSLAIVDGIEVSVGSSIFTIPINSINESIKLKEGQLIHDTTGNEMVKLRGQCFPLIKLHDIYGIESKYTNPFDGMVILVESEGRSACILVDELIGEQQIVVKPFSPLLNRYNVKERGMAGCTILGDGSITIILDISKIICD
jgi:two-component system chemotaxis sensor kinase CheA